MEFNRILLKLSGESLMGEKQYGIDETRLREYATQIREVTQKGVEIGIVIGGGNIFRGLSGASKDSTGLRGIRWGCWLRLSTVWHSALPLVQLVRKTVFSRLSAWSL